MNAHPSRAVLVTLWGGPLDGLQMRVQPLATRLHLTDGSGRDVVYVRVGHRWEHLRPEAAR